MCKAQAPRAAPGDPHIPDSRLPGEDRDFSDLLTFIDEVRPERWRFRVLPEEGADAATFPDQVPAELAAERRGIAMQRLAAISRSFGESRIGAVETVLVDGISTESELLCTARSRGGPDVDGVIYVGDATLRPGQFVDVRITDAADYDLAAEPV